MASAIGDGGGGLAEAGGGGGLPSMVATESWRGPGTFQGSSAADWGGLPPGPPPELSSTLPTSARAQASPRQQSGRHQLRARAVSRTRHQHRQPGRKHVGAEHSRV